MYVFNFFFVLTYYYQYPLKYYNILQILLLYVCNNMLYDFNNIIVGNAHVLWFILRHRQTAASYYYDNALRGEQIVY